MHRLAIFYAIFIVPFIEAAPGSAHSLLHKRTVSDFIYPANASMTCNSNSSMVIMTEIGPPYSGAAQSACDSMIPASAVPSGSPIAAGQDSGTDSGEVIDKVMSSMQSLGIEDNNGNKKAGFQVMFNISPPNSTTDSPITVTNSQCYNFFKVFSNDMTGNGTQKGCHNKGGIYPAVYRILSGAQAGLTFSTQILESGADS